MTRDEFMNELAHLLQDVQDEDKEDAMQYYKDYFDEAGPEQEAEVVKELGSPERIAAIIRSDISGSLRGGGEFTDSGYKDERFREPGYQMSPRLELPEEKDSLEQGGSTENSADGAPTQENHSPSPAPRTSTALKVVLWIILFLVASPFIFGIGGGLIGLVCGAFGVLIAVLVTVAVVTAAMLVAGFAMIPYGIIHMFAHPLDGLLASGSGLIFLGLGFLLLALCILFYGRFVPFMIRTVLDALNRLFHRRRGNS